MGQLKNTAEIGADARKPDTRRFFAKIQEYRDQAAAMTTEEQQSEQAAQALREQEWIRRGQHHDLIIKSNLEPELLSRTLDTFPLSDPGQAEALKLCKLFVHHFNRKHRRGLFLHGQPGRGKSGLMQGVAIGVLAKPRLYSVIYIPCAEIERLPFDVSLAAATCDLVIWDDLEKGLQNPGSKYKPESDRIIRSAINRADRARRNTHCFTSNYSLTEFQQRWPSFGSRLAGLSLACEVGGPDMREGANEETEELWYTK